MVLNKSFKKEKPTVSIDEIKPWLEVVSPTVFETDKETQKISLRELKTGDELLEGTAIKVEKNGLANIHFGDGSVARLDSETKIILESGKYNKQKDSLAVRVNLVWGRVWSKIIGLATPDSVWEVKTSNAVATVRGTAFGAEYIEEGKSSFVGYENKISVKIIDPDTKEVIKGAEMIVEPNKFLEIKKEAVQEIKVYLASGGKISVGPTAITTEIGKPIMAVKEAPAEMFKQDWVLRGIEEDKKLDEKKEEIQPKADLPLQSKADSLPTEKQEIKKETTDFVSPKVEPKPMSLKVVANRALDVVSEGEIISLKAVIIFNDGSQKDVTDNSSWKVIGLIGAIGRPGVFTAKLDLSVSELGSVPGAITAAWKDERTGEMFLGQTPIFKVEILPDTNLDDSNRG